MYLTYIIFNQLSEKSEQVILIPQRWQANGNRDCAHFWAMSLHFMHAYWTINKLTMITRVKNVIFSTNWKKSAGQCI